MNREFKEKPWGAYDRLTLSEPSTVKILTINPNSKLSLQLHHHRKEFWRVIKGSCQIIIGEKLIHAKIGDEFVIPKETPHRIIGTKNLAQVLELSFGQFDENDIERLEDDYNRK